MTDLSKRQDAIPFEFFASFKRIKQGNPIIALPPPLWAAATHAIVVDDTVHYYWCKNALSAGGEHWDSWVVRETELFKGPQYFHILYGGYDGETWRIGHVRTQDFETFEPNPHNPIFSPSENPDDWDCDGVLTGQIIKIGDTYYMLYAGRKGQEWQTGLAVQEL